MRTKDGASFQSECEFCQWKRPGSLSFVCSMCYVYVCVNINNSLNDRTSSKLITVAAAYNSTM